MRSTRAAGRGTALPSHSHHRDGFEQHARIPPPPAREWLTFALLRDAPRLPGGKYLGIETAPVEPWPHQRVVARRVVAGWPYSFLLCDEVGLGKTIEAGLALRALHLSGYVSRVLLAVPAHLCGQWQREMAARFFLPFARALPGDTVSHTWLWPAPREARSTSLYEHPLTIVSTGLMPRTARRPDLDQAPGFDVVLLDEAQCARRANPTAGTAGYPRYNRLYTLTERVLRGKARSLLLVTATPMQLHEVEAADLMRLTRRAGAFSRDPSLTFAYYRLLAKLSQHSGLTRWEWQFLRRAVADARSFDPLQWRHILATTVPSQWKDEPERWLSGSGQAAASRDSEDLRRFLFAAAPLSRTMLRHTRLLLAEYQRRGSASGMLAKRNLLPIAAIQLLPSEQRVCRRIEHYCGELAAHVSTGHTMRTALGFFSSFLQLRFASSLYAIQRTLERRLDKVMQARRAVASGLGVDSSLTGSETRAAAIEAGLLRGRGADDLGWEQGELESILHELAQLAEPPSKFAALLGVLQGRVEAGTSRIRQTVIFTRFVDTLNDLAARLIEARPDIRLGCYSGPGCRHRGVDMPSWSACARDEVNRRFLRGEIDVLLCSDAAAEGVNLQTADLLVNFDLPWNPMKLEQRIGRIDRIGQRHPEVQVLNLCYPDSVEQLVYGRLLERLEDIMGVVGRQNLSLLPVLPHEFERLAAGTLSFAALEVTVRDRLRELERRNALFDIPAAMLYDLYARAAGAGSDQALPASLAGLFQSLCDSSYLRRLGCSVMQQGDHHILLLAGVPGLSRPTALTVDRALYERGMSGYAGDLRFATWGEPAFDAVLEAALAHPQPRCVRKLEAPVPGTAATLIGFAVAAGHGIELVTSLAQLQGLVLDESRTVNNQDAMRLQQRLELLAQEEGRRCQEALRVEAANEEAGALQLALHCSAAASLLEETTTDRDAHFRAALTQLEAELADHELIRIAGIPSKLARAPHSVLFNVEPSPVADTYHVDLPGFMVPVLLDAARREADALRANRENLSVEKVVQRLRRQAERALAMNPSDG